MTADPWAERVARCEEAVASAERGESRLDPAALALDGMSGAKTRHLYNNLCRHARSHLEIGSWKGSSTVAALCNNPHLKVVAIDDWGSFGGPKAEFDAAVEEYVGNGQLRVVHADCWEALRRLEAAGETVDEVPFDTYLYDGGHAYEDQRRGVTEAVGVLARAAVVVVDDYDWAVARQGTEDALAALEAEGRVRVHWRRHISALPGCSDRNGFWNGAGVFLVERLDVPACVDECAENT